MSQVEQLEECREHWLTEIDHCRRCIQDGVDVVNAAALLRNSEARLSRTEHACQRAKLGQSGHCEGCGGPIEDERLKILPETTYCCACAHKHDLANFTRRYGWQGKSISYAANPSC